jgi:hypothetical protein
MKKVFSNSELVHVFATQTQHEGKSQNMFFYDKKIFDKRNLTILWLIMRIR